MSVPNRPSAPVVTPTQLNQPPQPTQPHSTINTGAHNEPTANTVSPTTRPLPDSVTSNKSRNNVSKSFETYRKKKFVHDKCDLFIRNTFPHGLLKSQYGNFLQLAWGPFKRKKLSLFDEHRIQQIVNWAWQNRNSPRDISYTIPPDYPIDPNVPYPSTLAPHVPVVATAPAIAPPINVPPPRAANTVEPARPVIAPPPPRFVPLQTAPAPTLALANAHVNMFPPVVPIPLPAVIQNNQAPAPQLQQPQVPVALPARPAAPLGGGFFDVGWDDLLREPTPKAQKTENRTEIRRNNSALAVPEEFTAEQIASLFRQNGLGESGKYCPICMETKEQTTHYNDLCEDHVGCRECIIELITGALKFGSLPPTACPGCHNKKMDEQHMIDPARMYSFLIPRVKKESDEYFAVKKWTSIQLRAVSGKEISENQCPECGCTSTVSKMKGEDGLARCGNPLCATLFCNKCGQKKHINTTCVEYSSAIQAKHTKEEEESKKYLTEASRKCPQCGLGIQHYYGHGCHHMTCPKCRFEFCYLCMAKWIGVHGTCAMFCGGGKCNCLPCPDCQVGKPCAACPGCTKCLITKKPSLP